MTRTLETTIDIAAPPETVWAILVDLAAYGSWNPLAERMDGQLAVENVLKMTVHLGSYTRQQPADVFAVGPGHLLIWSGYLLKGLAVRGVRSQWLEPTASGCRYFSREVFTGPFAGLTRRLLRDPLDKGLREMAVALRDRAEAYTAAVKQVA